MDGDEAHECPVPTCTASFSSVRGRATHFGNTHSGAEKRAVLRSALDRFVDDLGHVPSQREMDEQGPYSAQAYKNAFGSWRRAVEATGYDVKQLQSIPEQRLCAELQRVAETLGRVPAKRDMTEHSVFGYTAYRNTFGCWNDALSAAGFDPHRVPGEGATEYHGLSYGPNWQAKRRAVLERDDYQCVACHRSQASLTRTSLHVHHITPAREFGAHTDTVETDYEQMNDTTNLVTLCPSCHRTYEGRWTNCSHTEFARRAHTQRHRPASD